MITGLRTSARRFVTSPYAWLLVATLGILACTWFVLVGRNALIPPPFDVEAFLAPELFGPDRAPAAYKRVLTLVAEFEQQFPAAFDDPENPADDPGVLLARTDAIAAALLKAGALPPGIWEDPRNVASPERNRLIHVAANILIGRSRTLLQRDQPQRALDELLGCIQLGRHAAYRSDWPALTGVAIDRAATLALVDWAVHRSVPPEMIRAAIAAFRSLIPNPVAASGLLKAAYPRQVRMLRYPASEVFEGDAEILPGPWTRFSGTLALSATGQAGPAAVGLYNAITVDRLSWCDRAASERRQWSMTLTGPSHIPPPAGVGWSRAELDAKANELILIRLMLPADNAVVNCVDSQTVIRSTVEAQLALIAHHKTTGKYPERLDELHSTGLGPIPIDPYSGKYLGYAVAPRSILAPADSNEQDVLNETKERLPLIRAGQRFVYSVGQQGFDEDVTTWLDHTCIGVNAFPLPNIK